MNKNKQKILVRNQKNYFVKILNHDTQVKNSELDSLLKQYNEILHTLLPKNAMTLMPTELTNLRQQQKLLINKIKSTIPKNRNKYGNKIFT